MPTCVFRECKNHPKIIKKADGIYDILFNKASLDRISYFHFPEDKVLRERWRKVVAQERGEDLFQANESSVVCSDHFLESDKFTTDKGNQRIKKTAVPHIKSLETKPHATAGAGSELVACRACLAMDGRLLPISGSGFDDILAELTGVPPSMEGFPRHLCAYCRARLTKYAAFRDSCQRSTALLQALLERNPVNYLVTMDDIKAIDRNAHNLTNGLTQEEVIHLNPIKRENNQNLDQMDESDTDTTYFETNENSFIDVDIMDSNDKEMHVDFEKVVSEDAKSVNLPESGGSVDAEREINYNKDMEREEIAINIVNIEEIIESQNKTVSDLIESQNKTVSDSLELKSEISTKTTKTVTGNTVSRWNGKRKKKSAADVFPGFDIKAFEKEFNFKVRILSKEQQRQEIEEKVKTSNYNHCCKMCGREFKTSIAMKKHMLCHEASAGSVECEICRCQFRAKNKYWWRRHRKRHQIKFTCRECGFKSWDGSNAKTHSLVHSGKMYACRHCGQEYKYRASYFNHMRIQHPAENVACAECGETFLSEKGVMQHRRLAHGYIETESDFKCAVCEVSFSMAQGLASHKRSGACAAQPASFRCGSCGDSFDSDAARAAHTLEKHATEQYYCKECGVSFSSEASFALHTRRKHLGVTGNKTLRPLQRRARPPRRLSPARRRANPAPRAVCEVCGRSIQSQALKWHMYTHTDQKPHACPTCPKTFVSASILEAHLRSHDGERPFQCAHCSLAFTMKGNLVRHMIAVHLKSCRRYPCDICLKTFTTRSSVKLHVNTVHKNMPVPKRVRKAKKAADN